MGRLLDKIDGPRDLKQLSVSELAQVSAEIRELILDAVSVKGGHLASNLGASDLSVALHYTYDFKEDILIWDVGHQCYPHKILTGRRDGIQTVRQYGGLAGFPDPKESEYDPFHTSHAGVSVSAGLGIAAGDDLVRRHRKVVCVIGDGAMTAGVSLEALLNASELKKNLLIILNHNQMSISPNVGALSTYLDKARTATFYREAKKEIGNLIGMIPSFGKELEATVNRVREAVKHGVMPGGTIFEELGLTYFGPVDGHNMQALTEELKMVKELDGPILLHVVTQKGHGFDYTSKDPVTYHSPTAFVKGDGEITKKNGRPSYSSVFSTAMMDMADEDPRIVAITAAMAQGTALDKFAERFPDRMFDVGIAEQHAVAFASGLAKSGMRPVAAIYSTFLQRAYDQVFHDVCLQGLPVVFAIDRAGITGGDGATAQGNFDIAYLRTLPRISIMAPRNGSDLKLMLRHSLDYSEPVAIRYARESIPREEPDDVPAPIEHGRGEVLREGEDVALFGLGATVVTCMEAAQLLEKDGISVAVINARFAKPVDWRLLEDWSGRVPMIVTVEDHALHGGFGSAVLETASDHRLDVNKIRRLGIPDRFIEHGSRDVLMEKLGLDARGVYESVRKFIRSSTAHDEPAFVERNGGK